MATHQDRIDRWERLGPGSGPDYEPWITIQTPSRGLASRAPSRAAGRLCHLMSKLEFKVFLMLDYAADVVDIREQFPLFPVSETRRIARRLGVIHPGGKPSPRAMTSDFRVTRITSAGRRDLVLAVKYVSDLRNPRTLRVLELERTYWVEQGVPWRLVTEREVPPCLLANLRPLHPFGPEPPELAAASRLDRTLGPELFEHLRAHRAPLEAACQAFDERVDSEPGHALGLTRRLLAEREWTADLKATRIPREPLRGLRVGVPWPPRAA